MKTTNILFTGLGACLFLFVVGCSNDGVPSCERQMSRVSSCMESQFKSLSCTGMGDQASGDRIASYCMKENTAPDFREKCQQAVKDELPDLMKRLLEQALKKCL